MGVSADSCKGQGRSGPSHPMVTETAGVRLAPNPRQAAHRGALCSSSSFPTLQNPFFLFFCFLSSPLVPFGRGTAGLGFDVRTRNGRDQFRVLNSFL